MKQNSRPMGQWIARLLPKPRPRVRIPGEAWMLPCVVQLGVEKAYPPGAPSEVGHQCRQPPGPRAYRSLPYVPRHWMKKETE